jgi:hypothetical protein
MNMSGLTLYKRVSNKQTVIFYLIYQGKYIMYRWVVGNHATWEDNDFSKDRSLSVPLELRTLLTRVCGCQSSNPLEFLLLTGKDLYSSFVER